MSAPAMISWPRVGRQARMSLPISSLASVSSGLAKGNGWTIAEHAGDRTSDRTQRHYQGWGKVANGITTVHLSYVREKTGHALIGTRQ